MSDKIIEYNKTDERIMKVIWYTVIRDKNISWTLFCNEIKWVLYHKKIGGCYEIWADNWGCYQKIIKWQLFSSKQEAKKEMKKMNNEAMAELEDKVKKLKNKAKKHWIIF